MYCINIILFIYLLFTSMFSEILRRIKIFPVKSKSLINEELKQLIKQKYSESNKSLINEYNLDLEKYNYPL